MPASKSLNQALFAALAFCAPLVGAHEASASGQAVPEAIMSPHEVPDEARIASDLKHHARFPGFTTFQVRSGASEDPQWTTVRRSVRKGDVLEFRVTSIYRAGDEKASQHEVDSIISYQREVDGWKLLHASTLGSREVIGSQDAAAGDPC